MEEKKVTETAQKLNQLWYETGQALVQSTFDIQDRSMQYMQNSLKDGIETLKSHIEASQHLPQMENTTQNQQEAMQPIMESGAEAYKRNIAFLQRITEQGTETFRTNVGTMRDLTQTLMKKAQDQQHMVFGQ